MGSAIISIRNLGKRYRLGAGLGHDTLRDHLTHAARSLASSFRRNGAAAGADNAEQLTEIWALKEVSSDVHQGEVVGIIGRNGAGTSTLLKILSQITEPTEGEIRIRGRVSSLLEVGTGFHPELTGRENVFLNGAILGMTRQEIKRKFDEIVAFAEVEKFLDTPVKRYSSGMYVRLAFAVAAHLEPEILLVDEVLAVGDAAFQAKSLAKMGDVALRQGRTVVFVSHNLTAVQRLCGKGIYLEQGRIKESGSITKVLDAYQRSFERAALSLDSNHVKPGEARFVGWELVDNSVEEKHSCHTRGVAVFVLTLLSRVELTDAIIGLALWNLQGDLVLAGNSLDNSQPYVHVPEGKLKVTVKVRLPLKAGLYQLDVSLNSRSKGQLERCYLEPKLNILPLLRTTRPQEWHGLVTEELKFVLHAAGQLEAPPYAAKTSD